MKNSGKLTINNNLFDKISPVFVVAELSANHNQNIEIARQTILAAKDVGADAVKLQTYTPDTITLNCNNEYFQIKQETIWDGKTLYDLYKEAYTPWEWHRELKNLAESLGLVFFSTPFDNTSVDFLEKLNVPLYKIASFEIVDIPLIELVASKGKPIIMSTGIATLQEIQEAIDVCYRVGNDKVILLKCTSAYPAPYEDINLRTIPDMIKRFNVPIGISDHTLGGAVSVAAVALGASVVEKHLILDRKQGGPDAVFSMEPDEFRQMVEDIRNVEKAIGTVTYELTEKIKKARIFSRSLFVVEDIKKGDVINENNVKSIRPGYGLSPKYQKELLGKRVLKNLNRGTPLKVEDIVIDKDLPA